MSEHTAGPWAIERDAYGSVRHITSQGGTIASIHADGSSTDANARLIVAAPEMLEALEDVLPGLDQAADALHHVEAGRDYRDYAAKVRSLIAKVRGEAK